MQTNGYNFIYVKQKIEEHTSIKIKDHQIYTVKQIKMGLSPYDDKRHILNEGIKSLAYGHYKI